MYDAALLLSSKARFRVLRVLYGQPEPTHLRQIAALSLAPLFSVQRALKQLVREKVVTRRKKGLYVLYALNTAHPCHPFLAGLFQLEMKERVRFLAPSYRQKALDALDFSSSARLFFGDLHQ